MKSFATIFNCQENARDSIDNSSEVAISNFVGDSNIFNNARNNISVTNGGSLKSYANNSIFDNQEEINRMKQMTPNPGSKKFSMHASANNFNSGVHSSRSRNPVKDGRGYEFTRNEFEQKNFLDRNHLMRKSENSFVNRRHKNMMLEFNESGNVLSGFKVKKLNGCESDRNSLRMIDLSQQSTGNGNRMGYLAAGRGK